VGFYLPISRLFRIGFHRVAVASKWINLIKNMQQLVYAGRRREYVLAVTRPDLHSSVCSAMGIEIEHQHSTGGFSLGS
jgi:hypothetical protein